MARRRVTFVVVLVATTITIIIIIIIIITMIITTIITEVRPPYPTANQCVSLAISHRHRNRLRLPHPCDALSPVMQLAHACKGL